MDVKHQIMRSPPARAQFAHSMHSSYIVSWHALQRLQHSLPDIPNDLLALRMRLGAVTFFDALYEYDHDVRSEEMLDLTADELHAELIAGITLMVTAPR